MLSCSQCGCPAQDPSGAPMPDALEVPLGWMLERDRGRLSAVCPACTRRHARAIEGKLDQAWW